MTEHEAWLELARMFEPGKRLPKVKWLGAMCAMDGICWGLEYLKQKGRIDERMDDEMDDRLTEFFQPPGYDYDLYFWTKGGRRAPRATACGLLAAMTEPE